MTAGWQKPENIFLVLALLFGAFFAAATPPLRAQDERGHATRTLQFALGHWLGPFPARAEVNNAWHNQNTSLIQPTPGSQHYSPAAYLFAIPGMLAAYHAGGGPDALIYAARLTQMLGTTLVLFFALRRLLVLKWPLMIAALLPMAVFARSGISADATVHAFGLLFFSYLLQPPKHYAALLLSIWITAIAKVAYAPLAFAVLLMPRDAAKKTFLIFTSLLVGFGWAAYIKSAYLAGLVDPAIGLYPQHPGIFPDRQIAFILAQPYSFLKVLAATLATPGFWVDVWAGFIDRLGFIAIDLPLPVRVAMSALLLASIRFDDPTGWRPSVQQRVICLTLFCGMFLMMLTLFFIQWTPAGSGVILGFQGRYFYPLLPLLFLAIKPAKPSDWTEQHKALIAISLLLVALIGAAWLLFQKEWRLTIRPAAHEVVVNPR